VTRQQFLFVFTTLFWGSTKHFRHLSFAISESIYFSCFAENSFVTIGMKICACHVQMRYQYFWIVSLTCKEQREPGIDVTGELAISADIIWKERDGRTRGSQSLHPISALNDSKLGLDQLDY
jgi:hypothetical protein